MIPGFTMDAVLATDRQRARFQAVRRRVFEEMRDATSRKRLSIMLPFQALVIGVLIARGAVGPRLCVQFAAFAAALLFMWMSEKARDERAFLGLVGSMLAVLVSIWNTGGLASPLLLSLVPYLVGCAMNPILEGRRHAWSAMFLAGFVAMAALAHTNVGAGARSFAPPVDWSSGGYVALSFFSAAMATAALFKMSRAINLAYERIALELAVRREELCDESEGRTRALEGIAARLAHEVKNPLAAIKGLSTHVARNATDEKVKERLTIVAAEAERLQEIVEGFLSFSRGLDDLSIAATKPYDIARELSLLLETRAADAGVTIEVRGTRELSLNADAKKLRQALLNLVLNAMQASSRGATVTLEVAKSCADGAAVVRVMDRGQGMTPDVLERIRKPYYTTKEGGSGLGIAVARGIIEQHGGTLKFDSTSGRGTTAIVMLPACAMEAQAKKAKLPNPCRGIAVAIEAGAAAKARSEHAAAGVASAVASVATAEKVPS